MYHVCKNDRVTQSSLNLAKSDLNNCKDDCESRVRIKAAAVGEMDRWMRWPSGQMDGRGSSEWLIAGRLPPAPQLKIEVDNRRNIVAKKSLAAMMIRLRLDWVESHSPFFSAVSAISRNLNFCLLSSVFCPIQSTQHLPWFVIAITAEDIKYTSPGWTEPKLSGVHFTLPPKTRVSTTACLSSIRLVFLPSSAQIFSSDSYAIA